MDLGLKTYVEKAKQENELTLLRERLRFRCSDAGSADQQLQLRPTGDGWTSDIFVKTDSEETFHVGLVRTTVDEHLRLHVDDLVIFSPFRGLGLGRAALEAVRLDAEFACLRGIVWRLGVEDLPNRQRLMRFFAQAGFRTLGDSATLALA